MKRILIFVFSVMLLSCSFSLKAFGEINTDIGSKDTGDSGGKGNKLYNWSTGDYGVRFTLIYKNTGERVKGSRSFDFYKKKKQENIDIYHTNGCYKFDYIKDDNKINLINKKYLVKQNGYAIYYPKLWNVITNDLYGKKTTTDKINKFFTDNENFIKDIAKNLGVSIETLASPKNVLIFEPILYITYKGKYHALTSTELAVLDKKENGGVKNHFLSFSHKAIPISLFLKRGILGIPKYDKNKIRTDHRGAYGNKDIIATLGIGAANGKGFKKLIKTAPKVVTNDTSSHTDTYIYLLADVTPSNDSTPDMPTTVTFDIENYKKVDTKLYAPKNKKNVAYALVKTPKKEGKYKVNVTVQQEGMVRNSSYILDVKKHRIWEPLNPRADDKRPLSNRDFSTNAKVEHSSLINKNKINSVSWEEWDMVYQPWGDFTGYKTFEVGGNEYKVAEFDGNPYYMFGKHDLIEVYTPNGDPLGFFPVNGRTPTKPTKYTVYLEDKELEVIPGETAKKSNPDKRYIKSGYGIEANIKTTLRGNGLNKCTGFQIAEYFFPEFNYNKYFRVGEVAEQKLRYQRLETRLTLPPNNYSYTYYKGLSSGRFHFLPIWYPDGKYEVYADVFDCYTPGGQLKIGVSGSINCKGALWDDYHIEPERR